MNRLLLFLFGSICFRAQGGFSERFLNLCNVKGVKLYALREKGGVLYAETSLASFRKIRRCASRSGMRVRIERKQGLPFVYAHFARRTGLFIGIALACFLLFFYTRSVWYIEIQGNESISGEQIKTVLLQNGVYEGVLKKNINHNTLTYALYEALPDISWLNIGVDGSRLTVNVREAVQKPQNKDQAQYCNIVAAKDGVVDKITVYEGEKTVGEGYGVRQGQLLVSGIIYHEQVKKNTFHRARAEVYAYTHAEKCIRIAKTYQKTEYTGNVRRCKVLRLFRLRIPLYIFSDDYQNKEVSVVEHALTIKGKCLPIAIDSYEIKETETAEQTADKKSAEALARTQKAAFEKAFAPDTKILKVKKTVREEKECYIFRYEYSLYENIAKTAALDLQNKKSEKEK